MKRIGQPIIYTPESPLLHPRKMITEMFRDLKASFELAWRLIVRDIAAQYRQTILGYFWAVLPPLMTTLIFVFLNKSQIIAVKNTDVPYPLYVMTGTVLWQLFVDALNGPLKEVSANRAMLTKIDFPKEALIISSIGQVIFSLFIKLVFLAVITVIFGVTVKWTIIFIIFPIAGLLAIGTLIGILLVPAGVLYKDIQQGLSIIVSPLMFLTPIAYPIPSEGLLADIMHLNPITPLIMTARSLIFTGVPQTLIPFILVLSITSLLLFLGWIIYRVALPVLVERMEG